MINLLAKHGHFTVNHILALIATTFPLIALLGWQQSDLFDSPLKHRPIIIWLELSFVLLHIFLPGKVRDISWQTLGLVGAFALLGSLSSINAENTYASIARHAEIILHIIFGISIYQRCNDTITRYTLTIGIIIAFIYTVLHVALLLSIVPTNYDWVAHFPMFSNIRHWGYLLILVMCIIYSQILKEQTSKYLYILLFLTVFCIFWSGGRGSFIPAMFLIVSAKFICNISWRTYRITILVTVAAGFLASALPVENGSLGIARLFFLDRLDAVSNLDINRISANRISIYISSFKEQLQSAPLLGMGADNFRYSFAQDTHGIPTQPHSVLVQIIYEYGIIGSLIIAGLLYRFINMSLKCAENKQERFAILCILGAFFFSASVDGHFYHSFSLLCISLVAPLLINSRQENNHGRVQVKRTAIFIGIIPLLFIMYKHTQTFIAYSSPLKNTQQIETVRSFPSVILNNNWLNSDNPDLLKAAFELAIVRSDVQCGNAVMAKLMGIDIDDIIPPACENRKISIW
ncbi:O-antigen ligase family protein [Bermanella marisrubri]|uniref:O-antigen ligase-related domain-containing protein n=1 Tax=Bermanella marisrubri TaxID=207949 RepID=Q1MZQ2_9GAMM|nr:O-antigen ligase family protein [Bermanella marisrubri]EAT11505.1 hypothetical protein RED65_04840 [Oceanobacter sp. RED65] [Bermanella marisrubri]QIZ85079.1 O-antigen ligase family protein [Bermanella marisrubri]